MNVAIIGFGLEGKSSFEFLSSRGDTITICDQSPTIIDNTLDANWQVGEKYLKNLDNFDLIVRSAGVSPETILKSSPKVQDKITTNINLFLINCPSKNIISVTGTKGKGTTSSLITSILRESGARTHLAGNIGTPTLSILPKIQPNDWIVLELSSFQLSDIKYSPHIGVCLMVAPEHLNWHKDLANYYDSKANLFKYQKTDDLAIYYADNADSKAIANHGAGQKIPYYASPGAHVDGGYIKIDNQPILNVNDLKLRGKHNWQNVCAAITTAWQAGFRDIEAIKKAVQSFAGLEHRLEFVASVNDVKYFDDSFGTTPETAIVAIEAFDEPKILILGGSDKGADYDKLVQSVVKNNVKKVIAIGQTGPTISEKLNIAGFSEVTAGGNSMAEIVNTASNLAEPGDVVLLSPACASFGLFKDYKDRGNQFKQVVQVLV